MTLPMLRKYTPRPLWPALASLAMLMQGCDNAAGYATSSESAICGELRADLPSWSSRDTEQSKAEGLRFLVTFEAVCGRKS